MRRQPLTVDTEDSQATLHELEARRVAARGNAAGEGNGIATVVTMRAPDATETQTERPVTSSFRLYPRQLQWLRRVALQRQEHRGVGRADQSAILREMIDRAIAEEQ